MHGACSVINTVCMKKFFNNSENGSAMPKKMHAVSLTPHAVYDTACTIVQRPWKPIKGKSIKNIYVGELSYPTTTKILYINLRELHAVSLTPRARKSAIKKANFFAISKQNSKRL
jgi:hypothetical protein